MKVLDTIQINCPYCKTNDVDAEVGVPSKEWNCRSIGDAQRLLVRCSKCRMLFDLDFPGKDLHQTNAQTLDISGAVRYRSNPLGKGMAIIGLYINLFPGGGVLFALVTIVVNWRAKKGLRWISWINLLVSILWTVFFLYLVQQWRGNL